MCRENKIGASRFLPIHKPSKRVELKCEGKHEIGKRNQYTYYKASVYYTARGL